MTEDEIRDAFAEFRAKHRRPAWIPICDDKGDSNSWFGGNPSVSDHQQWPTCSECKKPMQFFLQLDLSELPDQFNAPLKKGLVQLFYCSSDDGMCETWMPFSETHEVRICKDESGSIDRPGEVPPLEKLVITRWEEISDTPHPEDHASCGLDIEHDFENSRVSARCADPSILLEGLSLRQEVAENASMAASGDKLGGWPCWVQGAEYPDCPQCGSQMELLMQIDSEDHLAYMFGDLGCAHLTQCRQHPDVLAFGWACG